MKGYKAFNADLTCLGYQYELDKTNIFEGEPILNVQGFHFCTELLDVFKYYFKSNMRVFEIEANGIFTNSTSYCSKLSCTEIKLVKELFLSDIAKLITKSSHALAWAIEIGNRDIVISKITNSRDALKWAIKIGNVELMANKINHSRDALEWAIEIGNMDIMIGKINEKLFVDKWLSLWPYDEQYFIDKGLIK